MIVNIMVEGSERKTSEISMGFPGSAVVLKKNIENIQ